MSYCRFENTLIDLKDCLRHIDHEAENQFDEQARQEMLGMFKEIFEDWNGDVEQYALYL